MPPLRTFSPVPLESLCVTVVYHHLIRELHLCYHIRRYQEKSLLLRRRGICSNALQAELSGYLDKLPPLLSEMIRQEILDRVMTNYPAKKIKFIRNVRSETDSSLLVVDSRLVLEMLEIVLNGEIMSFEFFHKSFKAESRVWKLILAQCSGLKRFKLVPNMFNKSESTKYIYPFLSQLTIKCSMLTELVLKDAVYSYEPLVMIGRNCRHLRKLDLTGSLVDCRDMFSLCIASVRDNLMLQFNEFYLGMEDKMSVRQAELNPLCLTLEALILCNTNVRSQGIGLVLRLMPNIQTLGTLVYTSAGMKNLYNLVRSKRCPPLKLKEVYYRGPSHVKLKLLSNCCPLLETLYLGSSPVRRINDQTSTSSFRFMHTLMLENISQQDITLTLRQMPNLRRLEVECMNVDISIIAKWCPKLTDLIVKKEPLRDFTLLPENPFQELEVVHLAAPVSLLVASIFFLNAKKLRVMEMVRVRDLNDHVLYSWLKKNPLENLETLILRFVALTRASIHLILSSCPKLTRLGEIGGWDVRSWECRRIKESVLLKNYALDVIIYSSSSGSIIDVFNDALSSTEFTDSDDENPDHEWI